MCIGGFDYFMLRKIKVVLGKIRPLRGLLSHILFFRRSVILAERGYLWPFRIPVQSRSSNRRDLR